MFKTGYDDEVFVCDELQLIIEIHNIIDSLNNKKIDVKTYIKSIENLQMK